MNDDFLTRFRKSPPREFSEALYKRINLQMKTNSPPLLRRLTFAAALCVALVAALAFSPNARAAFNGLIVEIGGMFFLEPDEAERQATPIPESQVTIVPQESLPLKEARAKLPYAISLPTWVPEGFKMGTIVRISYFPGGPPQATISFYGSDPNVGNIDLTVFGRRINWLVDTNDVQEVQVNGEPAALVAGSWNADTGQWDNRAARMLNWMKGNEMYQLYSLGAAVEELIRMAESIP